MIAADGSKYEGNWENNMQHGQGKYISETGMIQEGNWVNDKFIS